MTHDKKIKYMAIAASICNYGISDEGMDLLVSLYELVLEKEGDTDLDSIVKVKHEARERADAKKRTALLDQVSEKLDTPTTKRKPGRTGVR